MTCSTDAEERFPTSASERRLMATALSGRLRLRRMASITFGPPGCPIQLPMSSTVSPVPGQERGDDRRELALHNVGQVGGQHDPEAVRPEPPAERVGTVWADLTVRGDDPRTAGRSGRTAWPGVPAGRSQAACSPLDDHRRRRRRRTGRSTTRSAVVISARGQAQRAHLDRHQRGRVRRPGQQVVVQARERSQRPPRSRGRISAAA